MGNYLGVLQDSSLVAVGEKKDGGQWRGAEGHSLDTPTPNVSPVCPFISPKATATKPAWNFLGHHSWPWELQATSEGLGHFPQSSGHQIQGAFSEGCSQMLFPLLSMPFPEPRPVPPHP